MESRFHLASGNGFSGVGVLEVFFVGEIKVGGEEEVVRGSFWKRVPGEAWSGGGVK